jgi:hypothetical protein
MIIINDHDMKLGNESIGGVDNRVAEKEKIRTACDSKAIEGCPACRKTLEFSIVDAGLMGKTVICCNCCGYIMTFDNKKLNVEQ